MVLVGIFFDFFKSFYLFSGALFDKVLDVEAIHDLL